MNKIVLCLLLAAVSCQWIENTSEEKVQRRGLSTLTEGCKKGQFLDNSKEYPRCCYYKHIIQKETQKRIKLKVCSPLPNSGEKLSEAEKTNCKATEFADYSKGYFRCCYNEYKEVEKDKPKLKLKLCRRMKEKQFDQREAISQDPVELETLSHYPEVMSEEQLVVE